VGRAPSPFVAHILLTESFCLAHPTFGNRSGRGTRPTWRARASGPQRAPRIHRCHRSSGQGWAEGFAGPRRPAGTEGEDGASWVEGIPRQARLCWAGWDYREPRCVAPDAHMHIARPRSVRKVQTCSSKVRVSDVSFKRQVRWALPGLRGPWACRVLRGSRGGQEAQASMETMVEGGSLEQRACRVRPDSQVDILRATVSSTPEILPCP
jgi:hypothetical protein